MSAADLALFARAGIGDDLAPFRPEFPRDVWPGHANLGATAQFWLQRHDGFRRLGASLRDAAARHLEAPDGPAALRRASFRLLQIYLGELDGHHHVEDMHYFPLFRAADARLGKGFDILDADHELIHGLIHDIAAAATAYDAALKGVGDPRRTGDALAKALARTTGGVDRHLADEEDIVVPLILARTEGGLGIG